MRQPGSKRPFNINLVCRRLHGYAGLVTAPTLLFFAISGILQVFGLHEARAGYTPPAFMVAVGMLHKDQVLSRPHRHGGDAKPGGAPAARGGPADAHDADHAPPRPEQAGHRPPRKPKLATTLLKIFIAVAAASLCASTLVGIYISLQDPRRRSLHLGLLAVGVVIPAILVLALR